MLLPGWIEGTAICNGQGGEEQQEKDKKNKEVPRIKAGQLDMIH